MQYDETLVALEDRAKWIEGLEYTTHYTYTTQKEDVDEYLSSASKRLFGVFGIASLMMAIGLVIGIIFKNPWLTGLCGSALIFFGLFTSFYLFGMIKAKKRENSTEEVKLSFNAYGIVMKICSKLRSAVYAYEWNDFEQIMEYKKAAVGIKDGLAYIFPKRIFSAEEYERFRNLSFAAASKKCFYKNFTPKK